MSELLTAVRELYPSFDRVIAESPDHFQQIMADIGPEFTQERDVLLLETARLFHAWYTLGLKLQAERELRARPIV